MFDNLIFNVIVFFVFLVYYILGNINKILFYIVIYFNFDEMYKVFIGGYIDFVYFIILDGFNGIIGGKIRNEVMIFFVIFMKLMYVKNIWICKKNFFLFIFCIGVYWNKYCFIDLVYYGDSRINIVGNYVILIDKYGYYLWLFM